MRVTLYKHLARKLNRAKTRPGRFDSMEGLELLDKIIMIDQSPIGRTPRSNPATYTGLFDLIRRLYALSPEAKARGYKENRFSFNVKGGRCEACQGDGMKRIEKKLLSICNPLILENTFLRASSASSQVNNPISSCDARLRYVQPS